ncbi:MAG: hypothetical protein JNL10_04630 [Verrucomicrobiales bacterium]|nr:hypothetical protein [Verrucomicrobiales bacterium]
MSLRRPVWVVGGVFALLVFLVLVVVKVAGRLGPECVNDVRQVVDSPDGRKKIVVFSRNCGATTGFSTQVSILESMQTLPDQGGNAFIADKGTAKVSWKANGDILVLLDPGVRVFKKERTVSGVSIEYRDQRKDPEP